MSSLPLWMMNIHHCPSAMSFPIQAVSTLHKEIIRGLSRWLMLTWANRNSRSKWRRSMNSWGFVKKKVLYKYVMWWHQYKNAHSSYSKPWNELLGFQLLCDVTGIQSPPSAMPQHCPPNNLTWFTWHLLYFFIHSQLRIWSHFQICITVTLSSYLYLAVFSFLFYQHCCGMSYTWTENQLLLWLCVCKCGLQTCLLTVKR